MLDIPDINEVTARYGEACPVCGGSIKVRNGFFLCHECGACGDSIKFISLKEGIDYLTAYERGKKICAG